MLRHKKITNCKKCNKPIEKNEETYHGLCLKCYKEYLLEKIDHLYDNNFQTTKPSQSLLDKIKKFFKRMK